MRLAQAQAQRVLRAPCTSFSNLGKRQTSAPLQVYVLGVDEGAEGIEWLAGEEVCFRPLCWSSVTAPSCQRTAFFTHILKVGEEVGDGLALTIGQDIIVVDLVSIWRSKWSAHLQ